MNTLEALFTKYKSIIAYLFFGVLTTIANIVTYWICAHVIHLPTVISTIIAWVVAVTFAYVTNRRWVFDSQAEKVAEVFREVISFFSCRIGTELVDLLMMYALVDRMGLNDLIIKFIANVVVVVLNFVLSKVVVFRRR